MNGGGVRGGYRSLVASIILAASTTVTLTSSSSSISCFPLVQKSGLVEKEKLQFQPRFDGMRFIETLVTAHR